jgi:tetrahydromethanopterin S-methyltransferase subunit F
MGRCLGTKRDRSPCTVTVEPPKTYCWWHDPANAETRKRAASKGGKRAGRGRPTLELARLGARFEELAEQVLSGEVERGVGAVVGQLLNGARACVRDGLAAREQEELIGRLETLEQGLESTRVYA